MESKNLVEKITDRDDKRKTIVNITDVGKELVLSKKDEYDVIYGEMPKEYNEVVLVLDKNNNGYFLTKSLIRRVCFYI